MLCSSILPRSIRGRTYCAVSSVKQRNSPPEQAHPLLPTVQLQITLFRAALTLHLWSFDLQTPLSPGRCVFEPETPDGGLLFKHGRAVLTAAVAFAPQVPGGRSAAAVQPLEMGFSISCTETWGPLSISSPRTGHPSCSRCHISGVHLPVSTFRGWICFPQGGAAADKAPLQQSWGTRKHLCP